MKGRIWKDTPKESIYIYLLIKTPYKNLERERFDYWEKSWEEIRACREKFEVETKSKNMLRVNKRVLWDIYDYWFASYVYRWICGETL